MLAEESVLCFAFVSRRNLHWVSCCFILMQLHQQNLQNLLSWYRPWLCSILTTLWNHRPSHSNDWWRIYLEALPFYQSGHRAMLARRLSVGEPAPREWGIDFSTAIGRNNPASLQQVPHCHIYCIWHTLLSYTNHLPQLLALRSCTMALIAHLSNQSSHVCSVVLSALLVLSAVKCSHLLFFWVLSCPLLLTTSSLTVQQRHVINDLTARK